MAKLVVLYRTPTNAAAFDRHYAEVHVPLARRIPGLRRYDVSVGGVSTPTGPSPYHLIATLYFDSVAAIQAGFGSPEGQAAAADVGGFATGGVEMLIFDETTV